jgi:hypothetical protein
MEAGGVGIWRVGGGSDVGVIGVGRALFGRSPVVREVGYANF